MGEGAASEDLVEAGRSGKRVVSDSFVRPACTLEQIRTFLVVASREHITHAARTLGLSQPAVTQQVQLLERALGLRLLERLGRGVRLTEAGEEIAGICLVIMRALEKLENTAQSIRGLEAGSLAVGASQVAAGYYLSSPLTAFSAAYPAIDLDITIAATSEVCEQVACGLLECGVVDGPLPKTNLSSAQLATDEVILAVHPAHPLASQKRLSADGTSGTTYLVWEQGSASEMISARLLGSLYQVLPRARVANLEAARRQLLAEPGFVSALPRIAIAGDLASGALIAVGRAPVSRPICAVRRPGSTLGPAADAFWAALSGPSGPSGPSSDPKPGR
jgi:DNA-binding transcriptional LysR family regulator